MTNPTPSWLVATRMAYDSLAQERELALALATLLRLRYEKQRESSSDLMLSFLLNALAPWIFLLRLQSLLNLTLLKTLRPVMPILIVPGKRKDVFYSSISQVRRSGWKKRGKSHEIVKKQVSPALLSIELLAILPERVIFTLLLAYLEPSTPTSRLGRQDFQRAYSFNGNCS